MKNNQQTCPWPKGDPLLTKYHDKEWGVPLHKDKKLFEFLILEGFQAGLSWLTILRKRGNFRKAFDNFDFNKIAAYDGKKKNSLLNDSGIIRNRLKIESAVSNAKAFIDVRKEFGTFDKYIWKFTGGRPIHNGFESIKEIPARTKLSDVISRDLKKRGFKFVGSTIVYAHMQATGMVNDHIKSCFRYKEIVKEIVKRF
ncbi:MAG: DNA-3-methyladenine glycosylase I [Desulfobacterales bacterium]|jgi:DNA-3-methyladenine glycosylase I|nr:DNA-3-methyladenine glycosylase I [Desulfobacterales bacterium]